MATRLKKEDIMLCALKLMSEHNISSVLITHQKPEDKRVKFQLQLKDENTGRNFVLMANTTEDVQLLLPKLLDALKLTRKDK